MIRNGIEIYDHSVGIQCRTATWFCAVLWIAACGALAFTVIWPLAAGIVSCCDDVEYSRFVVVRGTFWDNLVYWWRSVQFRPIDLSSYFLVNLETLDARATILLHLPGLAAILGAMWVALKRLTPQYRLYFPMAVLLWCLHVSTTITLWQHDTIAQTWVSACGLWLGLVAWKAIERAWAGQSIRRQTWIIMLLSVIGVLTKEIFYGWVAAVGMLLIASSLLALRRRKLQASIDLGKLFLATIIIPVCFFSIRWFAGMNKVASAGGGRYSMQFGTNLIRNVGLSAIGYFTTAPVHVLRDPLAPWVLRVVPLLAVGLNIIFCVGPWLITWSTHREWPDRPSGKIVALIALVTFLGVSATLPMGQISELYIMGPNAGAAIIITIGLVGWWQLLFSASQEYVSMWLKVGRVVFAAAAFTMIGFGVYGVASRAYHFRLTWSYVSYINRILLDHQRSLPPDKDRIVSVFFPPDCTEGLIHSQYVSPPAIALNLDGTEAWLNYHDPLRRIKLVCGEPTAPLAPGDLLLDCSHLPPRDHW
jgi:hypothetical protein